MRYVLRADASRIIGSGHVMRTSAIAEELINRGEDVVFVGWISDLPWVEERISTLGFSQIYSDPSEFVSNPEFDILLLDSYEIKIDDDFIDLANWRHIIAIVDDQTPNYSCSLRIHPGLDSNWVGQSSVSILAGPKYIPFRANLHESVFAPPKNACMLKIVVVAGGSDPHNLVLEISKVLVTFPERFEAHLFTNVQSGFASDSRFNFVKIGSSLDEVSKDANLILTTSSTSSLEFLARGLCVGIACAVDNQKQYYHTLSQLGVAAPIGLHSPTSGWKLDVDMIHKLVTESDFRAHLTRKAHGLIDFSGARRIIDAIKSL
jgi:spore coat polysaccharide biosynthesis predicted glycosyltransferase SpsG